MAKIQYREVKLAKKSLAMLEKITAIVDEYQKGGYRLTLRQLYYQLVSRDVVANSLKSYKNVGELLKNARMGGLVDWELIEDRLRVPQSPEWWDDAEDRLKWAERTHRRDRLAGQKVYMEVWVEKDALSGVLSRVTQPFGVPIMVNRGYSSATAMHDAFQRFNGARRSHERTLVIYLGDFDPSGLDMIRDIKARMVEFCGLPEGSKTPDWFKVEPIALTRAQIKKYNPPPNPAKESDSRFGQYQAKHGNTSWEVDALRPDVLHKLLEETIKKNLDMPLYEAQVAAEVQDRQDIRAMAEILNRLPRI